MNILIDTVRIAGFRGIENLSMTLSRVTVMFGANNTGKTSVLKAIQLALGDYSRHVAEEDFNIDSDEKRVQEILVDIRIIPVDETGGRKQVFDDAWVIEFGDKIKSESDGNQYLALRTRCKPDVIKGGFEALRFTLEKWPDEGTWTTEKIKETRLSNRFLCIPFVCIEAQRDIQQELKEKTSFVGRVLSSIAYDKKDIKNLESLIKKVNEEAVSSSSELKGLKTHLDSLNRSFQGSGNTEITPFPKKIRDLSKHFSIHFGENLGNSFSMEYHGMGTRSWASMLTVKAFIDLMAEKHGKEEEPFFPILAAEEPEAHLHPNAQKIIYQQLAESKGQIIISTHSPYLLTTCALSELRHLTRESGRITAKKITTPLTGEPLRRIHREIIHSRGEILFSKAWILCEGETEEQALPLLFYKYYGDKPFAFGVNFIGVGGSGKRYLPFLTFAKDFSIPVYIFSDGEAKCLKDLKECYESVFGKTDIAKSPNITVLDGVDFEEYLLSAGFKSSIEGAITHLDGSGAIADWIRKRQGTVQGKSKVPASSCPTCKQSFYEDVIRDYKSSGGYDKAMLEILDHCKTKYAPVVAEMLCKLPLKDFPPKVIEFFEKIKTGVSL